MTSCMNHRGSARSYCIESLTSNLHVSARSQEPRDDFVVAASKRPTQSLVVSCADIGASSEQPFDNRVVAKLHRLIKRLVTLFADWARACALYRTAQ